MSNVKTKNEINEVDDRLFFHDLVNQTHGMILFLSNKSSLDASEINLLKSEIKLLQTLVQRHFNFNHKNLEQHDLAENQSQKIESTLAKMIAIYYSEPAQQLSKIIYKGEISGILDFVSVYRILNNIVKNMAEANVVEAQFLLEFNDSGLNITTQNQIADQNSLDHDKGLGLKSMASIAQEAGGFFQYEIHNNTWVNQVFLPYKNSTSIKKIAA